MRLYGVSSLGICASLALYTPCCPCNALMKSTSRGGLGERIPACCDALRSSDVERATISTIKSDVLYQFFNAAKEDFLSLSPLTAVSIRYASPAYHILRQMQDEKYLLPRWALVSMFHIAQWAIPTLLRMIKRMQGTALESAHVYSFHPTLAGTFHSLILSAPRFHFIRTFQTLFTGSYAVPSQNERQRYLAKRGASFDYFSWEPCLPHAPRMFVKWCHPCFALNVALCCHIAVVGRSRILFRMCREGLFTVKDCFTCHHHHHHCVQA